MNLPTLRSEGIILALDASGKPSVGEQVVLPGLKIGSFHLKEIPTRRLSASKGKGDKTFRPVTDSYLLLGNNAFEGMVLTIDYRARQMRLRKPIQGKEVGDNRATVRSPNNIQLPIEWSGGDWFRRSRGIPTIKGTIGGQSAHLVIVTGWGGEDIGIATDFLPMVQPYLDKYRIKGPYPTTRFSSVYGVVDARTLPFMSFSLTESMGG